MFSVFKQNGLLGEMLSRLSHFNRLFCFNSAISHEIESRAIVMFWQFLA